jgi:predicted transcriptional regulator
MKVKNLIAELKKLDLNEDIAVSYWTRPDAEDSAGSMTDDAWEQVCSKFGDNSSDEIRDILFAVDLY